MPNNKEIFERYSNDTCTPFEKQLIEDWLENLDINAEEVSEEQINMHLRSLDHKMRYNSNNKSRIVYSKYIQIAAVLAICFAIGYYIFFVNSKKDDSIDQLALQDIKAPSSSNAVVLLENGEEYNLDELSSGDTIVAKGYKITKLPSGELNYINISKSDEVMYNVLRTKSGGTAQVKLSDGSQVWLNANSELKYPINFFNNDRNVELKGEGYFEIESSKESSKIPFYVIGENITIKVFGTKFNVDFYKSTPSIALLEGSIGLNTKKLTFTELSNSNFSLKLVPNQYYDGSNILESKNIERFVDWKDGYFDLNEINLAELADKMENWYGVQVSVDAKLNDRKLYGRLDRNNSLEDLLDIVATATPISYTFSNNTLEIKSNKY